MEGDTAGPRVAGVEVERVIGRGASSVVYLGTQVGLGRKVAVKVLDLPGQSELVAKLFVNECRTLGRLSPHPNIVTVFDSGFDDAGRPYLVMEYLPGGTLAEQLATTGPLDVHEALRLGVQLAGALHTTHLHGIVHGDVKPHNVLRTRSGEVALSDFGVARLTSASSATTRAPLLTPLHAAPELFEGHQPTARTDVYGLGSTLFELLDGKPALGDDSDSPLVIVGRLARGERRDLDRSRVPDAVADLIESALALEPDQRPADAAALGHRLRELQESLGDQPSRMVVIEELPEDQPPVTEPDDAGAAEPVERPTLPPPRSAGRGRVLAALAVVAVVVLAGVLWWALRPDGQVRASGSRTEGSTRSTGTTVPQSDRAGIQSDVTYDVPRRQNQSSVIATRLADTGSLVAPFGAGVTLLDYPSFQLESLPATARYQAFNPAESEGCTGFMSRPITVVGLWEKTAANWGENRLFVRVLQFDTVEEASEAFVAFSIEQGPLSEDCSGFARPYGVEDYEELDVVHRDPVLQLPEGVRYNAWYAPPPDSMPNIDGVISVVVQHGTYVIPFSVGFVNPPVQPEQVSQFVANLVDRLG